jgi:hypothetical protein
MKDGTKLPEPKGGPCSEVMTGPPEPRQPRPAPPCGPGIFKSGTGMTMEGINLSMAKFTGFLGKMIGREVIDRTGFTKRFDLHLEFAFDDAITGLPHPPRAGESDQPADPLARPSIMVAVQEQLGLKLESTKGSGRGSRYRPRGKAYGKLRLSNSPGLGGNGLLAGRAATENQTELLKHEWHPEARARKPQFSRRGIAVQRDFFEEGSSDDNLAREGFVQADGHQAVGDPVPCPGSVFFSASPPYLKRLPRPNITSSFNSANPTAPP